MAGEAVWAAGVGALAVVGGAWVTARIGQSQLRTDRVDQRKVDAYLRALEFTAVVIRWARQVMFRVEIEVDRQTGGWAEEFMVPQVPFDRPNHQDSWEAADVVAVDARLRAAGSDVVVEQWKRFERVEGEFRAQLPWLRELSPSEMDHPIRKLHEMIGELEDARNAMVAAVRVELG